MIILMQFLQNPGDATGDVGRLIVVSLPPDSFNVAGRLGLGVIGGIDLSAVMHRGHLPHCCEVCGPRRNV
jgi:hypothetical protein